MNEVIIGKGKIFSKGVYANKDFKKGEAVIKYNLQRLTKEEFKKLSKKEKNFTHEHWETIYLYSSPERYVNHSSNPNTVQDLKNRCDVAIRNIKKGEEITTDSSKDDKYS